MVKEFTLLCLNNRVISLSWYFSSCLPQSKHRTLHVVALCRSTAVRARASGQCSAHRVLYLLYTYCTNVVEFVT
jgi:hypothetical protein